MRDGNARAEQGGAWAALFDADAESDAYLGWQAPTQARQGLPSAMPVLPSRILKLLEATTLPTACATLGTRAQPEEAARHALRASTRTHSGTPSVQTARQVRSALGVRDGIAPAE